jgi:hypothetical protein
MLFKRRQKKSAPFSFFGARTAGTKMSFTRVILLMVGLRKGYLVWQNPERQNPVADHAKWLSENGAYSQNLSL